MRLTRAKLGIAVVVAILMLSGLGAGAYNTFQVDRTATMDVVSDSGGIIQLSAGPSKFVTTSSGELLIDVTQGGATGVNVNATLEVGNESAPTTTPAFNLTNNDNAKHNITLSYTASTDGSTSSNVKYLVYDSSGTKLGTATEESSFTITDAAAGATYHVVIKVDTTAGSTTSDDLSGTLTITSE